MKASRVRMSEGFRSSLNHLDGALAGEIGHFPAVAVGRRNGGRAGKLACPAPRPANSSSLAVPMVLQ